MCKHLHAHIDTTDSLYSLVQVAYDDGDTEILNLKREKWEIIEDESAPDEVSDYLPDWHSTDFLRFWLTFHFFDRENQLIPKVQMFHLKGVCVLFTNAFFFIILGLLPVGM